MSERNLYKSIQKWLIGGIISIVIGTFSSMTIFYVIGDQRKLDKKEFEYYRDTEELKEIHTVQQLEEIKEELKEIRLELKESYKQ